jgi:phosphatidylserine decarboxylase
VSAATYAAAQLLRILPRVHISRAVGRLCEAPLPPAVSRTLANLYVKAYRVDMDEVDPLPDPYPCFDAFFTRQLRPGARSVSADPVVSPADGAMDSVGKIDSGARITVKRRDYDVAELTGDPSDAKSYVGGSFAVVYLSPRDYHRVHSPVDGRLVLVRGIAGDQFPVNVSGERHVPRLFVRNQRVAIVIETERLGRVTVVMVGAVIVGRISVKALAGTRVPTGEHRIEPPRVVRRGDEIGTFHLGSTAVLLLQPGVSIGRSTGTVRYGESLSRAA